MRITKHGKKYTKESKKVYFKCDHCNCEFTAEEDEYYRDYGGAESSASALSSYITISYKTKDYLVCSCPECHKIVKFLDERETSSGNITPVGLSGTGSITLNQDDPLTLMPDNPVGNIHASLDNKTQKEGNLKTQYTKG